MGLTYRVYGDQVKETVVRFSLNHRLQHTLIMVAFTVLVITGIPQRFSEGGWAQWIIDNLGGIYATRIIHRIFGLVFTFTAVYHIGLVLYHFLIRKRPLSMLLTAKDYRDAIMALRYDLGVASQRSMT